MPELRPIENLSVGISGLPVFALGFWSVTFELRTRTFSASQSSGEFYTSLVEQVYFHLRHLIMPEALVYFSLNT